MKGPSLQQATFTNLATSKVAAQRTLVTEANSRHMISVTQQNPCTLAEAVAHHVVRGQAGKTEPPPWLGGGLISYGRRAEN